MEDIRAWTDRLDPTHDYNDDVAGCTASDGSGHIHLRGFEHSPFVCGLICCDCCAPELSRVQGVYTAALHNLHGGALNDEHGEPIIVIEPERHCEP